ncbi:MAG: 1-acyl-sn-glycerol-3-phosphate acyltransferase [Polyangiaceae bacterium]|nr:1-acyl-sn-glycerol-3-phosphate acyltransferase [Polyangiaceae bacterium]
MRKRDAKRLLDLIGWEPCGERPTAKKYVLIAAPHTSNWDLPIALLIASYFEVEVSWLGKKSLFDPPLGWLLKRIGGIAVDRDGRHDMVQHCAALLRDADSLALMIPAEGTRGRTEHWKSGFYWIAHEARVPIVCARLDYAKKQSGFGAQIETTGDVKADMDKIRAFYADAHALYPEDFGPVRLRDEESPRRA